MGVVPAGFYGPELTNSSSVPDIYLPMHTSLLLDVQVGPRNPRYADRNFYWVEMMGRLHPGVNAARAQSALAPRFRQFVLTTTSSEKEQANFPTLFLKEHARGERLELLRRQYSKPVYVLLPIVGLILAITCANIASWVSA